MDEAAFLQAILANPDDDSFRLVYADWLEEQGDPRSEVLRTVVHVIENGVVAPTPRTVKAQKLLCEHPDLICKDWLAQVSRGWIEYCNMKGDANCPGKWECLQETDVPSIRRCSECNRDVWFCWIKAEVQQALKSRPWHPVVKAIPMKPE